jgi:centromere/kinetochore protein ZW10
MQALFSLFLDIELQEQAILAPSIYYDCLGKVVDATLSDVVDSIISMDDITESESQRLADLCRVLEPVQTLFVDSGGNVSCCMKLPNLLSLS